MRILLIEDQNLVRQGIRCLLSAIPGVQITEVATAADGLSAFTKSKPDVVIISNGLERASGPVLMKRLVADAARARVLMVGRTSEVLFAARLIEAGAKGFITLRASSAELIAAVHRIADGRKYLDKDIASVLAQKRVSGEEGALDQLTLRELEIIKLLGEGKSMKAIAKQLDVAYKTVANACSALKSKLGVKRTADLIRLAIEMEEP